MEIIKFDEIDSTQNCAKELVKNGVINKIVCAKIQTNGRGRIGNNWQSLEGGLWFSFIIDIANINEEKLNLFTIVLGISVYQVCFEYYDIKLKLKWPNDLLLKNKKVCGILCEKIENKIVAGVGVNTNIDSEKLIECATSLLKETGIVVDNDKLLNSIIDRFYHNIDRFNKDELLNIYRENMAYINEKKYIKIINKEAVIKGICDNGALIIELDGEDKEITFGEIS